MQLSKPYDIYFERGNKKVFACAIDWPGWCRSGRDESSAVQALLAYALRYAEVCEAANLPFALPTDIRDFRIVERHEGNSATSYGVPNLPIPADYESLSTEMVNHHSQVLVASWWVFDETVKSAQGKELRKGPRGGGRELIQIVSHVAQAEKGYLMHLGWMGTIPEEEDIYRWMQYVRREVMASIQPAVQGEFPDRGPHGGKRWPLAYFMRRVAWHVLDHAWEIEDRVI